MLRPRQGLVLGDRETHPVLGTRRAEHSVDLVPVRRVRVVREVPVDRRDRPGAVGHVAHLLVSAEYVGGGVLIDRGVRARVDRQHSNLVRVLVVDPGEGHAPARRP